MDPTMTGMKSRRDNTNVTRRLTIETLNQSIRRDTLKEIQNKQILNASDLMVKKVNFSAYSLKQKDKNNVKVIKVIPIKET